MSAKPVTKETVLWVGIRTDNPAFKGLAQKHRLFIEQYAWGHLAERIPIDLPAVKPIFHCGAVIGYGVAVAELGHTDQPIEFPECRLIPEIERARGSWYRMIGRVSPAPQPSLFIQAG